MHQMRADIWNIGGYGARGRRTQIREFASRERLDFVALQETIKPSFTPAKLSSIDLRGCYAWHFTPATGHSRCILLGVNEDTFEVLHWSSGAFHIRADVLQLDSSTTWSFFVVYGPADHRRSPAFLQELTGAIQASPHPLVVGGDFNMIRGSEDKNNTIITWPQVHRFNDCIANLALREIRRGGARFTWINKQLNPIICVLDRVFMSAEWEALFPLCSLAVETIVGSDHSPLLLSSGEELKKRSPRFFFEKAWLERPDFVEIFTHKWRELES